jgi:hypothetical protein
MPKTRALVSTIPLTEQRASIAAEKPTKHINRNNGRYLRDEAGCLLVILHGRRVSINESPDNHALAGLMQNVCQITTVSPVARAAARLPARYDRFWIWTRKIEHVHVGRAVRVREDTIEKLIATGTVPARAA